MVTSLTYLPSPGPEMRAAEVRAVLPAAHEREMEPVLHTNRAAFMSGLTQRFSESRRQDLERTVFACVMRWWPIPISVAGNDGHSGDVSLV